MDDVTSPLLFLSGAGLPAWIWDDVRAMLPEGVDSAVAEYPRDPGASLAAYAQKVAADSPWPSYGVVAHSIGGVVGAELLHRSPGSVTSFLGVSAVIPAPGRSFIRSMPLARSIVLRAVLRVAGTRPPEKAIRSGLTKGLPRELADRIVADFSPESVRLYRDPVGDRALPARCGYVSTTADAELPAAMQQRSAAQLSASWTAALPTGHMPMLEDPTAVAEAIDAFSRSTR